MSIPDTHFRLNRHGLLVNSQPFTYAVRISFIKINNFDWYGKGVIADFSEPIKVV